jgi:hypothetical protein
LCLRSHPPSIRYKRSESARDSERIDTRRCIFHGTPRLDTNFYLFTTLPNRITAFGGSVHRFAVPVGDSSLILSRIIRPESVLPAEAVPSSPEKDHYNLQVDDIAFKCGGDSGAILINFFSQGGE